MPISLDGMVWCFNCRADVFGKERESCHDKEHDLDYENLFGNARIRKLKPKKKSTLVFKKKIDMTSEVPYE